MKMEKETIKVHDLGVAAALVTLGYVVQKITYKEGHRAHFEFESTAWTEQLVEHYWSRGLRVDARKFFENTKTLKSRIYADK